MCPQPAFKVTLVAFVWLFSTAFSNVSWSRLRERMHNHIDCICVTFLCCAFANVSSICLPEKRHNHTGCICLVFLHCVLSNESSNGLLQRMHSNIDCICLTFSYVHFQMSQMSLDHTQANSHWLHLLDFTVCFQMRPQRTWISTGKLTLVAFIWLISTVRFQLCPQIACPRIGIFIFGCIHLAFSSVCF